MNTIYRRLQNKMEGLVLSTKNLEFTVTFYLVGETSGSLHILFPSETYLNFLSWKESVVDIRIWKNILLLPFEGDVE